MSRMMSRMMSRAGERRLFYRGYQRDPAGAKERAMPNIRGGCRKCCRK